ncbi:hypothetical protein SKAU_G00290170 [Synaphobranchus kaupii]|uniref:Uncharacterized protein n=1 Tax=Synaphobranchus kaupii TaxID=118154 RepID=A0A9Q1ETS6_SYNKA|nr:hypothetical protein SKAU_G00290170 [Synaphobranchus kaupii]
MSLDQGHVKRSFQRWYSGQRAEADRLACQTLASMSRPAGSAEDRCGNSSSVRALFQAKALAPVFSAHHAGLMNHLCDITLRYP